MVSTAARVGSINVLLSTQLGPGVAGLNAFANAVDKTGSTVSQRVAGMDRSIAGLNTALGRINTRGLTGLTVGALRASTALDQMRGLALAAGVAVGGLAPAAIASAMIRTTDAAHRMSNQLRTVTTDTADLKNTQDALFQVAQRTRSAFDSTVTIYARTARATEHLGLSQEKLLRITETVQKAFAVGGASAAEAQGAAIQLSQGIASNRFSGEEFRSVAENAPVLLRGMAESLGVNIGKLREMAHAGQLTADVVTKAILDASKKIDEDFAKTTSTIEQAWVRVGNAVTKYAMDSEKASAGSLALVGGLNMLSDNVSGLVDIVLALGAALTATFAARRMQAVTGWVSGLKAARIEALAAAQANQALAQAQMQAARADFLQKRLAFNAALNAGTLSAKQLERQKRALAAASANYRAATQAATSATVQLSTAQKAAAVSGMAMSAAGRAASAAWSFIGGPMGAALLALTGIMYLQARSSAQAEAAAAEYAEAIKKAGEDSNGAAGGIRAASAELSRASAAAGEAARNVSLASAQVTFEDSIARMRLLASSMRGVIDTAIGFNSMTFSPVASEVDELVTRFEKGEISAEELRAAIDKLAAANPDNSAVLARIQEIGDIADASRGRVDALIGTLEQLQRSAFAAFEAAAGLTDRGVGTKRERPPQVLGDDAFNSRFGGRYADPWKKVFPDLYKKEKQPKAPRKTADDRFDNSVQAIYDRIEALRMERDTLGATFYEQTKRQEALKLEQEALKQAREEARRKGDADWQNAQISKEKRAEIEKVTEELAREADAHRKATEAMQFQKDIMKDVLSGLREALADGKITWEELGDIAIRVLDKIINKIEDELIDAIFRANQAGQSGGGGGLFGWLGKIFNFGGGGGGFTNFEYAWTAAVPGLYDKGGYTGPGGKYQPAGVVHAGEYVFSQSAVRRLGVDNLEALHEAATRGFSDGGYVGGVINRATAVAGGMKDNGAAMQYAPVYHIDARGAQRGVGEEIAAAIAAYDKGRVGRLAGDLPELRRRGVIG